MLNPHHEDPICQEPSRPSGMPSTMKGLRTGVLVSLLLITIGAAWGPRFLERSQPVYQNCLEPWFRPDESPRDRQLRAAVEAPFAWFNDRFGEQPDSWRQPLVALTFDDGPYPLYTAVLLEVLRKHQVKATFFLVGRSVEQQPELTRQIAAEGHELANHTFSHRRETQLRPGELESEILDTEDAIASHSGVRPHLFRPAGGKLSAHGMATVRHLGYTFVDFTVNPGDWWVRDPQDLFQGSFRGRSREGVVLLHTGSMGLVRTLPTYIEQMRQRGFRFVTVSELVAACQDPLPVSPRLGQSEGPGISLRLPPQSLRAQTERRETEMAQKDASPQELRRHR